MTFIPMIAGLYLTIERKCAMASGLFSKIFGWISSFWCKSTPAQPAIEADTLHTENTGDDLIHEILNTRPHTPPWAEIFRTPAHYDFSDLLEDWNLGLEPLYENKISVETVLFLAQYVHESHPSRRGTLEAQWALNAARLKGARLIQKAWRAFARQQRASRSRAIRRCAYIAQLVGSTFAQERFGLKTRPDWDGYQDYAAKIIQKNFKIFKAQKQQKMLRKGKGIQNTQFPRLGHENVDGCDCWLPDPTSNKTIDKRIMLTLFMKTYYSPIAILGDSPTWIIKENFNQENLVLVQIEQTFILYVTTNCHKIEGESNRFFGHSFRELVIARIDNLGDVVVLKYVSNSHTQDLASEVEDQHQHVRHVRALVEPHLPSVISKRLPNNIRSKNRQELVLCGDEVMTREEKRQRKKAEKSIRRQTGEKKPQLPIRYQNLTSQEYDEVVRRENEDLKAWMAEKGRKAFPQSVREYLQSPLGSRLWHDIHNFAIARRAFALSELAKMNRYLRQYKGLQVDLLLNENLVKIIKHKNDQAHVLRQAQIAAREARVDPAVLAARAWQAKTSQKREKEHQERAVVDVAGPLWADYDDDSLPDLDFENKPYL